MTDRRLLNYRQVEAFKVVAESGSMTRAANVLNISQPAVSKLVGALERRVGFALFDRRGGRLRLTAEGALFYEEVDSALIGVQSLAEKAEDIRARRRGRLVIGAMPALSSGVMQRLVADLMSDYRSIAVSLQTRTSPQLMNLTQARQLDLAALAYLGDSPLVKVESIHRRAMVCVMPVGHHLATRRIVRATDIAEENLIALSTLDQLRPRIELALVNEGVRPASRIDTALAISACAFAAEGLGVALVDPFSASGLSANRIVVRPFEPRVEIEIAVVRPAETKPSALARDMIARLQALLEEAP